MIHTPHPSPVGDLTIVTSDTGVVAVLWPDDDRWDYADAEIGSNARSDACANQLDEYFAGERTSFDIALDLRGTEFQTEVWNSLANIEFGQTRSYGEQAAALGRPKAMRAVGSANGKNPVSIILPCHRVVGSTGKLTGYAGGLDAKRWLLNHEAGTTLF